MPSLAVNGGTPVRTEPFPARPVYDERESQALQEVLESRHWSSAPNIFPIDLSNSKARQLEEQYAAYHGCRFGVATGGGTQALYLAYVAAGLRPGDEVILPPDTFVATASPVLQLGAVPVFADVDPETLCIDPSAVEAAITGCTRLIVPLHQGGYPADMDRIMEIARRHGLKVVADAAHAHGAEWRGGKVAGLSDLSAFSFQQDKAVTCGEGGIVITDDESAYERCYIVHNDGRGMQDEGRTMTVVAQGWNFRMSEFQAALMLAQMEKLDELLQRKNRNAELLGKGLSEIGGLCWPRADERVTCQSYVYPRLRYDSATFEGLPIESLVQALTAEGIPCTTSGGWVLYREPLFTESLFHFDSSRRTDYSNVQCPNAEAAIGQWIRFPQEVMLASDDAMDDFIQAVAKIKKNVGELL